MAPFPLVPCPTHQFYATHHHQLCSGRRHSAPKPSSSGAEPPLLPSAHSPASFLWGGTAHTRLLQLWHEHRHNQASQNLTSETRGPLQHSAARQQHGTDTLEKLRALGLGPQLTTGGQGGRTVTFPKEHPIPLPVSKRCRAEKNSTKPLKQPRFPA